MQMGTPRLPLCKNFSSQRTCIGNSMAPNTNPAKDINFENSGCMQPIALTSMRRARRRRRIQEFQQHIIYETIYFYKTNY